MKIAMNVVKRNQGDDFDPRNIGDEQLTQAQLSIARNMLNILSYID